MTARRGKQHDGAVRPACRPHGDPVAGGGDGRPAERFPDIPGLDDDARRWARLAALGQRIVEGLDDDGVEQAAVDEARVLLGADVAGYARVAADPPALEIRAVAAAPGALLSLPTPGLVLTPDVAGMSGQMIVGEPYVVTDVSSAPGPWGAVMRRFGFTTVATVLVGRLERPHGILGIGAVARRAYTPEDIAILQALASLLAGALERAAGERAVRARVRQQQIIADLGTRVVSGLSVPALAEAIVGFLAEINVGDVAGILRLAGGDRRWEVVAGRGVTQADIGTTGLLPGTIGAATLASDDPILVTDIRDQAGLRVPEAFARLGIVSMVVCRIGERQAPWGLLGIGARTIGRFDQDDAAFVRGLANLIASAVALEAATAAVADNARRIQEARFEERTALAREIHDGLVQDLWLVRLRHGLLAEALAAGDPVSDPILELGSAIDRASEDARQAVLTLRAGDPGRTPLAGDLTTYARDVGERLGIEVEVRAEGDLPHLPPRTEAELLRIVQEVLTNAARHAGPTRVVLEASIDRRGLVIGVADDGRGFDPTSEVLAGLGLTGMRERASLIGASVAVRSAPGRGTAVTIRLPRRSWRVS